MATVQPHTQVLCQLAHQSTRDEAGYCMYLIAGPIREIQGPRANFCFAFFRGGGGGVKHFLPDSKKGSKNFFRTVKLRFENFFRTNSC